MKNLTKFEKKSGFRIGECVGKIHMFNDNKDYYITSIDIYSGKSYPKWRNKIVAWGISKKLTEENIKEYRKAAIAQEKGQFAFIPGKPMGCFS